MILASWLKPRLNRTADKIAQLRRCCGKKLEDGRRALSDEGASRARVKEAGALAQTYLFAQTYLKEKRWASLAIAAGIGLVLGFILGRRD